MSYHPRINHPLPAIPTGPFDDLPPIPRTKETTSNHSTPSGTIRSAWDGLLDVTRRELSAFRAGIVGESIGAKEERVGDKRKRDEKEDASRGLAGDYTRDLYASMKRRKDSNRSERQFDEIALSRSLANLTKEIAVNDDTGHALPPRTSSNAKAKKPRIATAPQYTLSAPRNRRRTPPSSSHSPQYPAPPRHPLNSIPANTKFTFRVDPSLDSFPIPPSHQPAIAHSQTPVRPTYQRRNILRASNEHNLESGQRENAELVQDVFFDENGWSFRVAYDGMKAEDRKELDRKRIADLEGQVKELKRELSSRPKVALRGSNRDATKSPATICDTIKTCIRSTPKKSSNLATTSKPPMVPPSSRSPTVLEKRQRTLTIYGEAISTDEAIRLPLPPGSISPFVAPAPSRIPLRPLVLSAKATRVFAPLPNRRTERGRKNNDFTQDSTRVKSEE